MRELTGTNQPCGLIFMNLDRRPPICFSNSLCNSFFPVTMARGKHPFPSRTRPLRLSAAMVLRRRPWESSTLPGLF